MKNKLTYILLALLTFAPMSAKADAFQDINSLTIAGTMNDWNTSAAGWAFHTINSGNQAFGTFYLPVSTTANSIGFKLVKNSGTWYGLYSGDGNNKYADFNTENSQTRSGWYNGDNVYANTITAASGYVKWECEFWGEYGGNSKLTITQSAVEPLSASLSAAATTLTSGGTTQLTSSASGGSGSYEYEYSTTAGSVSEAGVFTAPEVDAKTTVTIKVTAKDAHSQLSGLASATSTVTITVKPGSVQSTEVTISETALTLKNGSTHTLTAEANGTNKAVTWSTNNSSIASVANGVVTAGVAGEAIITATAADGSGVSASCTVTVKEPTKLYLNTGGSILWDNMSPRYAAYFFDNTAGVNEWVSMTPITATPHVYTVEVPIDHNYSEVIFVRMNPNNSANRWNNDSDGDNKPVWDQTGDLTFSSTDNFYHITSWGYNNRATGYWNTYTEGAMGEQATEQYNASAVQKNDPRVMLQACYWESFLEDSPYGQSNWKILNEQAETLGNTFDLIWLPPSARAADRHGYLPIDYNDQNGYWGNVDDLKAFIKNVKQGDRQTAVVADIVMNHIAGEGSWCNLHTQNFGKYGFYTPTMDWICSSDEVNRPNDKGADGVTFGAGMERDECTECEGTAHGAEDTGMGESMYYEKNYDSARDWDHTNPIVQSMMISYLKWLQKEIGYAGWRYDFGKGVDGKYIEQYNRASETQFSVMEYFDGNTTTLIDYIKSVNHNTMVFDFGTKFDVFNDGIQYGDYNKLKTKGLISRLENGISYKRYAVTFIDSHDTFNRPDNSDMEFMERGNSMLPENKEKVLLANAYLLSMPGVPCVAYPHWHAYKEELIPMIQARKDAGVHSESTVVDEVGTDFDTNNFYNATITGTNGSLKIFLGPNSGYETYPEGYTLVAKGTNYGMYAQVNGTVEAKSVSLDKSEITVAQGMKTTLTANLFPAYATTTITWSSNDTGVAKVENGVITAVGTGTTTITATTANGKTATCTVTVVATTSATVYFEVSGTGWGENIGVHTWCDGYYDKTITATKLNIPHATKTWYAAEISLVAGGDVYVQACKIDGTAGDADYSEDIAIEAGTVEVAYVINSVEGNTHHSATPSDELNTSRKFVYSLVGENHYYSNRITADDEVSYFTSPTATDYSFCYGNDVKGYTEVPFANKETIAGIYYATVTGTTIGTPQAYTGNYYIRSEVAAAGWDGDYKTANKMEKIADYGLATDVDQYYWVDFIDPTKVGNKNAKAAVANNYNDYLAETSGGDYWITGDGDSPTGGANVRYGWNPATNTFTRDMMGGSTTNNFLTLYATEANKIFKADENGEPTISCHAGGDAFISFKDATDYMYSAEVYAVEGAMGVMEVHHGNNSHFLFSGETHAKQLLEAGFEGDDGYKHRMKVYYDFKTKRISSAWMPTEHIEGDQTINRKLCISRAGAGEATTFTMDENAMLTVDELEIELYITREECKNNGGFFWFSLPFDCQISTITGLPLDEYRQSADDLDYTWVVQRYRGDLRANGTQANTYWRDLAYTTWLQANRGYVLYINPAKVNWEFGYITVFFHPEPNVGEEKIIIRGKQTISVDEYIHNTKPAESNWSLIGSGTLQKMKADTWTTQSTSRYAIQKSFYTWRWDNVKETGVYSLANAEFTPMTPTQSYFVQYAGTIDMKPHAPAANGAPAKLLAPAAQDEPAIYFMQMEVSCGEQTDKTYIILDKTATEAYDLNLDLGKIINSGMPQLYTLCATSKLAANNLPALEDQSVYVGLTAVKNGTYTFSMPRVTEGVTPMLYDLETGAIVNLALDDYTVDLNAGTYETRFSLRLNKPSVTTDSEQLTANGAFGITIVDNALLISGITGEADIRLYDALGRELYHTTDANTAIPVFQTGVYLVSVNGAIERVLVR